MASEEFFLQVEGKVVDLKKALNSLFNIFFDVQIQAQINEA
jgi:hypothetical protein